MRRQAAIARALVLIVMLVAVFAGMRWLNSPKGTAFFRTLGFAGPELAPGHAAVQLCPARIRAIQWASGARVEETDGVGLRGKWMLTKPPAGEQSRELAYLDLERWLSKHCEASGVPSDATGFAPFWEIEYVDGSKASLERSGSTGFRWRGQAFESRDLQGATAELAGIAGLSSGM